MWTLVQSYNEIGVKLFLYKSNVEYAKHTVSYNKQVTKMLRTFRGPFSFAKTHGCRNSVLLKCRCLLLEHEQVWFLLPHQQHQSIRFTKKHPDAKQDNDGCMNHKCSDKNSFSRRTSERSGCRIHFFVRSMKFDPNELSVNGFLTGNEAFQKLDLGHGR